MGAVEKFLLILLVAWIVWRFFGRRVPKTRDTPGDTTGRMDRGASPRAPQRPVEDMIKCPKCGAYVAGLANHRCEG